MFSTESVFVTTTNKTGPISPFDFRDKLSMLLANDIPGYSIIESSSPYMISKTLRGKWPDIDLSQHKVVVVVGLKDMNDNTARFSFKPTRSGTPKHFQPYININDCEMADKHAYILCAPTFRFETLEHSVESATEIRKLYHEADPQKRIELISSLYPFADSKISYLLHHSFRKLE